MTERNDFLKLPIFFERNRVFRVYTGGMPYRDFFADKNGYDDGTDNFFPEEWVASEVKAFNQKTFGERDGVSVVKERGVFFDDLLREHPEELLGGSRYDCLVKILDSAVRLPFQAHPDKAFAKAHFGKNYGKTEAWLVLATREDASICFGFKQKMSKEEISRLEEASETDKTVFDDVLFRIKPRVGDVFLIRAGLVHAIGAGCTILEVQEPTDFTVQPERWCADYHLNPTEEFVGLDKDTALDVINYDLYGEEALNSARITPRTVLQTDGYVKECLIGYEDTPCFAENRHVLTGGSFVMENAPSVYICVEGEGKITGEGYEKEIRRGDYFFLPYAAKGAFRVSGRCTLVECLPSKQD